MSFSYSGDPAASDLDEVRFLLHDTDETSLLLEDEEIEYLILRQSTVYGDALMAAAICADMIADKYAGEVSISADGVSYSGDQLQQKYAALATSLRTTYKALNGPGGAPLVGGINRNERRDRSVKALSFGKGMHDNLWAGRQDYGERGDIEEWDPSSPDGGLNTWIGS